MTALVDEKRQLRTTLKARLAALPASAFVDAGVAVATHLEPVLQMAAMTSSMAPTVALFASRDDEIDVRPLEAHARRLGIQLAVPRIDGGDLAFTLLPDDVAIHDLPRDRFDIPTPPSTWPTIPLWLCAVVVCPGLAFDVDGGRLGFGRGYYDRAFADGVNLQRVVAILLDEQLVERVPVGADDVRLCRLCTPTRGLLEVQPP